MKEEKDLEERKGEVIYFPAGPGGRWTPEEKAEFVRQKHGKLNKAGERYFSSSCEPFLIVNNPEAVYGR